jgi:hypothetical protein
MSGNRWFRFYAEAMNDPKVDRLQPSLYKTWVKLLCLACTHAKGHLPSVDDIAYHFRLSVADAQQQIDELILADLIDILPGGTLSPHNWGTRQYVSDKSADRMRKHREKKKSDGQCDVTHTVTVTPPEQSRTDTDTELAPTPLPPSREVKEQVFKFELKGQGKGNGSEVRKFTLERAEGFGLDVTAILAEAQKGKPSSLDAYFRSICRRKLKEKIPHVADEVLKAAFERDGNAFALVCAAILEAA